MDSSCSIISFSLAHSTFSGKNRMSRISARAWPKRQTPPWGREAALAGFAELVCEVRVRPLNTHLTLKVPFKGWLSSSMCHFWFRTHLQQPPRPCFLEVALRKEQCRLQPSLRPQLLPLLLASGSKS
jgi:hypothetical protein